MMKRFLWRAAIGAVAATLAGVVALPGAAHQPASATAPESVSEPVSAAESVSASSDFRDVPAGHPFAEEISWLAATGVSTGYADGTFRPAQKVTREAMAEFLERFDTGVSLPQQEFAVFTDVPVTHAFFDEIFWLSANRITTGYANGSFGPGQSVQRQAMAAFLYRVAGKPAFTPPVRPTFSDVPRTHQFFREVEWLASTGITKGYGNGTFRPEGAVERQAMAAFLQRFEQGFYGGRAQAVSEQGASQLSVTSSTTTSVTIAWPAVSGATDYRLTWARIPDDPRAESVRLSGTGATISGLRPGLDYRIALQALNAAGDPVGPRSNVTAPTTALQPVSVATFNVSASPQATTPWVEWKHRRQAVWDTVNARHPDVIALQEASFKPVQANGEPGTGHPEGVDTRYYGDVVRGLTDASGAPYRLTEEAAWNCANPWNPAAPGGKKRCAFVDQGASSDTRIAYNTSTLSIVESGSKNIGADPSGTDFSPAVDKYLAWAVFEQRATGKRFFFTTIHLDPWNVDARVGQAAAARAFVQTKNTANLPVVFAGDLNTGQWSANGADHRRVLGPFAAAGYTDLAGAQPASFSRKDTGLDTAYVGRANCNSFNAFGSGYALAATGSANVAKCWHTAFRQIANAGTNIDYILTKGVARAPVWENTLRLNDAGAVIGNLPSDHVMIRAEILL